MNKSSQYNQQQTESKQCKSEVEELRIHQNHLKINTNSGFYTTENFSEETTVKVVKLLGSYMEEKINF